MLLVAALLAVTGLALAGAPSASAGGGGVGTGTASSGDRDSSRDKYAKIWDRTSKRNKRWANRTAQCESGKDPNAIGGGGKFRGAFQFMKSTWRSSPKSPGGDPIDYNYKTQAVVAVKLKQRDGAGHWPNCG
ncbi:hypothetical protein HJD18_11670 [Thermoleophilia bacterium SCSIO 60948]|nr:hypothetical protein HJD18_11670 [Thermoleophilia bacterium SCSIO 60948]